MKKWYVECKAYGKKVYITGVPAKDGKEAIEFVREHLVIGAQCFYVEHDDDDAQLEVIR